MMHGKQASRPTAPGISALLPVAADQRGDAPAHRFCAVPIWLRSTQDDQPGDIHLRRRLPTRDETDAAREVMQRGGAF